MPKLKRLSGKEVINILARFGFEIYSQSGSHIKLERITLDGARQRIVVPKHANKGIKLATLMSIYRTALQFIPEEDIRPYFYADS